MIRCRTISWAVAAFAAASAAADAQVITQPSSKDAMKPLKSPKCSLELLSTYRRSGHWEALQACARHLACDALAAHETEDVACKVSLAARPVELVAYVPGATEKYDVIRVLVRDEDAPIDASLNGSSDRDQTAFRQVFVADRQNATLTSRFSTTPEIDPRLSAVSTAASTVVGAVATGIGAVAGSPLITPTMKTGKTGERDAPPPPSPRMPTSSCVAPDGAVYAALDTVTVPQRRATIKIADAVTVGPTCAERHKLATGLADAWRRTVGAGGAAYVAAAAAAAAEVLTGTAACHVPESTAACDGAILAALDRVYDSQGSRDPEAAREADKWVRSKMLAGPEKSAAEFTVKAAPRDWWSVGMAIGYMFHRQNPDNMNVKTTDATPTAYKADPFNHALTMVTVNFSAPYDASSVTLSKAERVKFMVVMPVLPTIGAGAGLGFYPTRTIGVSAGYALLVSKRPTSGAVGEAVRDVGDPFTNGWLNTVFLALNVKVGG